jgi:hypothetical protein
MARQTVGRTIFCGMEGDRRGEVVDRKRRLGGAVRWVAGASPVGSVGSLRRLGWMVSLQR